MKRELGDGIELDDDKARIDRVEVHRFLCEESYWAAGRPRQMQDRLIDEASRVVGLYDGTARSASAARRPTASRSRTSPMSTSSRLPRPRPR